MQIRTKTTQPIPVPALLVGTLIYLLATAGYASQDPPGCSANNLNVNIGVTANNVTNATLVTWFVTVQNPNLPTSCAVTLGPEGLWFDCPGPDGNPTGQRTILIPGGTKLDPGFGPTRFDIPCLVNVSGGIAIGEVSAPGSVVHKNPLSDDPANVDKTISVNVFHPCIHLTTTCISAINASGSSVTVTYSGTVTNCGDVLLQNVTVLADQPSAGTVVLGPLTLAAGAGTNFTTSYVRTDNLCGPFPTALTASGVAPLDTPVTVSASASSQCSISYQPGIRVTSLCPELPVQPGQTLTISGVVSNTGNIALTNVTVINSKPAANNVLLGPITLGVGEAVPYTGTYTVPADSCPPYTDTVVAQGTSICSSTAVSSQAPLSCPGANTPAIVVNKICPASPVPPGGTLTYTGTVTNTGNITLNNVTVVSDKPSANTRVFGPVSLAPGAGAVFTAGYSVPTDSCGPYTSTLVASGLDKCFSHGVTNSITLDCPGTVAPAISISKTCPTTAVAPGGLLTFGGSVLNAGNVTLSNIIIVVDRPTPGTIVHSVASLAPGASASFTGSYTAPVDECSVSDTLSVTATDRCGNQVANSTTTTCPIITTPAVAISQTCPGAPVLPGAEMPLQGFVTNTGNITLTNVTVVANRPAANTLIFGPVTLAPGQSAGFIGSFTVPADIGACSISSTVTAGGNNKCNGAGVTASASQACPLVTAPKIVVTKACPPSAPAQGTPMVFSGSVSNAGNITLTNILVMNDQPVSNTLVFATASLAPGQVTNFTASYTTPGNCCSVTDTLTATGKNSCDGTTVTDTATAICPVQFTPLIKLTKTCPTNPALPGETLTYSGTVSNAGNITLTEIVIYNSITGAKDPIFGLSALAPGESWSFQGDFIVPIDFCEPDSLTATAVSLCGEVAVSDTVTSACPVTTTPGVMIFGVGPTQPVVHGQPVTFVGTVTNTGNVTLNNVMVVNSQPAPNTLVLGPVTLAPGQTTNFTHTYIAPTDCNCCELVNTFAVTGVDRCASRHVSATFTVVSKYLTHPSVVLALNCSSNGIAGQSVSVTGTVMNAGDITLTNVLVTTGAGTNLVGPITLARGETQDFTTTYTAGGSLNVLASAVDACTGLTVTDQHSCGQPSPGVTMSMPSIAGGMITLPWNSVPGVTYRVQSSTSLVAPAWVNEPGDVVALGSSASKSLPLKTGSTAVYYRVISLGN